MIQQGLIRLDNAELNQRREHAHDADRQSLEFRAEQLSNHDPRYWAETQREGADINSQADERHQTERRHVDAALLLIEVEGQGTEAHGHHRIGDQQQHPPASPVHQLRGRESEYDLCGTILSLYDF